MLWKSFNAVSGSFNFESFIEYELIIISRLNHWGVAVSASGNGNRHNITARLTSNQSLVSAGPLHKVAYKLLNSAKDFHREIIRVFQ